MSAATARLELRITPQGKARIERAAELSGEPVTSFARTAAEEKADRILREREATMTVPPEFFDELIEALNTPAKPNAALRTASEKLHKIVARE